VRDEDLLPAGHAEAARLIATLRGLYGDLGDALGDLEARRRLLAEIEREHVQLLSVVRRPVSD
jgi:hypothetical protein